MRILFVNFRIDMRSAVFVRNSEHNKFASEANSGRGIAIDWLIPPILKWEQSRRFPKAIQSWQKCRTIRTDLSNG